MVEFALAAPILFLVVIATFEFGRFIFYYELLNNATREGARYAIVHGSRSDCPSGPPPPGETNPCDPDGSDVKDAVGAASLDFASSGELFVFDPVWTSRGSLSPPRPGDASTGSNGRGDYVSVFVDFTYDTMLGQVLGTTILPSITIRAESTLVVNN
jgi:TadE-like protein